MYKQDESLTFFIYVHLFFHKKGMVKKLTLDEREDASFVSSVAKSLFADGTTNWGRVVSLMAFGAVVSQYLKEKGRGHCVEQVGQEISTYLLTEQRDWLVKNNSWVSCYGSCLNDRMFEKKKNWLHNCPHCATQAYVSSAHTPLPLCFILGSPSNEFSSLSFVSRMALLSSSE